MISLDLGEMSRLWQFLEKLDKDGILNSLTHSALKGPEKYEMIKDYLFWLTRVENKDSLPDINIFKKFIGIEEGPKPDIFDDPGSGQWKLFKK